MRKICKKCEIFKMQEICAVRSRSKTPSREQAESSFEDEQIQHNAASGNEVQYMHFQLCFIFASIIVKTNITFLYYIIEKATGIQK